MMYVVFFLVISFIFFGMLRDSLRASRALHFFVWCSLNPPLKKWSVKVTNKPSCLPPNDSLIKDRLLYFYSYFVFVSQRRRNDVSVSVNTYLMNTVCHLWHGTIVVFEMSLEINL